MALRAVASVLATEYPSRLEIRAAFIHMQVGTANVRGSDFLTITSFGCSIFGVRNTFHSDVAESVVNGCFHNLFFR
jgi:hypothetical protein